MADLNQLKQKYTPVINTIQSFSAEGAKIDDLSLEGDKLHLKASVPSPVVANRVWDEIKKVDSTYADLHHEIATTGSTQSYTIQSGDNLSKVSKHFYGDPNKYEKIAQANNIADANKISAGQTITIPA
jgi:nucleoid-associated protein YgaU